MDGDDGGGGCGGRGDGDDNGEEVKDQFMRNHWTRLCDFVSTAK